MGLRNTGLALLLAIMVVMWAIPVSAEGSDYKSGQHELPRKMNFLGEY